MGSEHWTCIPKPEFKKDMFDVAGIIRNMVLKTSGSEEGLNVVLTIMATFACSMNDKNWRSMMRSVEPGLVGGDGSEAKMEQAVMLFFTSLNKLRKLCDDGKSQYISKGNIETGEVEDKKDTGFTEFPERGGLSPI